MIAVAAWIAEQERLRISERTLAGLERARLQGTRSGKAIGRPSKVLDRDKVRQLHAQGWGYKRIAKRLSPDVDGGVSPSLIQRLLLGKVA
jgi:DNA invertase Pin-like site-specific DNA recombinase